MTSTGDCHIFQDRISIVFSQNVKQSDSEELGLSFTSEKYGIHSVRKGTTAFTCSGSTACRPSFAATSLRAS